MKVAGLSDRRHHICLLSWGRRVSCSDPSIIPLMKIARRFRRFAAIITKRRITGITPNVNLRINVQARKHISQRSTQALLQKSSGPHTSSDGLLCGKAGIHIHICTSNPIAVHSSTYRYLPALVGTLR